MNIFPMAITLLVGFMLFVVVINLLSKLRGGKNNANDMNSFYQPPYEGFQQDHHVSFPSEHGASSHTSHSGGDWGGRDMSSDHHDFGDSSDSGGGGDWGGFDGGGGDAGGGEGGGGGDN